MCCVHVCHSTTTSLIRFHDLLSLGRNLCDSCVRVYEVTHEAARHPSSNEPKPQWQRRNLSFNHLFPLPESFGRSQTFLPHEFICAISLAGNVRFIRTRVITSNVKTKLANFAFYWTELKSQFNWNVHVEWLLDTSCSSVESFYLQLLLHVITNES